jgi:acyl-CoA dehydrogenase
VTDPGNASKHKKHTLLLVDPKAPGVEIVRAMSVFGYDDAPEGHCEVVYNNVVLDPKTAIVGGVESNLGRGFEMLQARLGPGRIHHCMRSIGVANRALDLMELRISNPARKTFGKQLNEHGTVLADVARSRAEIEGARFIVVAAARQIDLHKAKGALKDIGIAKFSVPEMALRVIDRAMQVHGAEGISQDQPLASMYAHARTLRYADGPDEVHIQQVAKVELRERLPYITDRAARVHKSEIKMGAKVRKEAKL